MTADYVRPADVDQAVAAGGRPGAVYLAGGTDLLVPGNPRREGASLLVSLRDVEQLRTLEDLPDGRLFIGAMVTHARLAASVDIRDRFAALAQACEAIGSASIRAAATVGGNLCTAVPSADAAVPLLLYDAQVVLRDGQATQELSLRDFFTGPGRTVLGEGELLLGVRIAPGARPGSASAFRKISRRAAMDIALVGAAASVDVERGVCTRLVLALGAVAPTPVVVDATSPLAEGRTLDGALLDELADLAEAAARPITDIRASMDYRRAMIRVLVRDVTDDAWRRALARERGV